MQVEGDNQRNIRSDRIADLLYNVSVGFPDALSHHRTMHREKHAVEAALPGVGCDRANQMIERGTAHQSGRDGASEQCRDQLKILLLRLRHEAADLRVGALVSSEQRLALDQGKAAKRVRSVATGQKLLVSCQIPPNRTRDLIAFGIPQPRRGNPPRAAHIC